MSESELTTELIAATRCWREKAERRKARFAEYTKDLDRRNDKFRKLQGEIQSACYIISQCKQRSEEVDDASRKLERAADKLLFDCFCHYSKKSRR